MSVTRHVYRIFVNAPIERVWAALIEPEFTRAYFHNTAFERPPVQGEGYRTVLPSGDGAIDGMIEVFDPPHRFTMTWHTLYDTALAEEPPSRVEWTLSVAGDGLTQVDLVHGDLSASPRTWAHVKDGWVWILAALKTLLETGDRLPAASHMTPSVDLPDGTWHRTQAIECNNLTWDCISGPRTTATDEQMLRRAYAAAYHWSLAAGRTPANEARATWLLAKVHLLVGAPERSLQYADSTLQQCVDHGLVDFDLAYAHEARARALAALGRAEESDLSWTTARSIPISDDEDRAQVEADFAA